MDRDEVEFLPRFQVEERLGKRGNFESLEPMMRARCAALAGYVCVCMLVYLESDGSAGAWMKGWCFVCDRE